MSINEYIILRITELVVVPLCFNKEVTSAKVTDGTNTDGHVECNKTVSLNMLFPTDSGSKNLRHCFEKDTSFSFSNLAVL